jgi:hypothetical protein
MTAKVTGRFGGALLGDPVNTTATLTETTIADGSTITWVVPKSAGTGFGAGWQPNNRIDAVGERFVSFT